MVKKTEKALSLGQRAKAKAQRAARAARELERGVSTRAGSKASQGVERIPETSTRNLGRGFGLRQTGEGKGSRMATKAQRDAVVKSGRKRVAGGAAASLLAGQSLFGDDKGKSLPPGGGVLDPNKAKDKESPKKYNVGVSKGGVPFKEAFKHHRGKGAKTFTWNGKKYTTELDTEKAKRTAAKKPAAKKKVGGVRKFLFGADGKMGGKDKGEKGLLDNRLTRAFTKRDELNELRAEVAKNKPVNKMGGGMMKSKMASKGGAKGGRRPTGMKAGGPAGKFPDLTGDGQVTQADILKGRGVTKKMGGGMMKSKMASKGGAKGGRKPGGMNAGGMMKPKGMSKGGKMGPKGYAKGGAATKKGMAKGGTNKKRAVSRKPRGVGVALRGYGKAMR